jgi:hypothetical protein
VFTVSSPSLPALSHEQATVTRVFIPLGGPAFVRSDDRGGLPLRFCFMQGGDFLRSFLLTTRSLLWYITPVK